MKERDLDNITIGKKLWKKSKRYDKVHDIVALDTETERGKAFVIGAYDGKQVRIKRIRRFEDYKVFIKDLGLEDTHNFYYNLTYDFQALIKHLSDEDLNELADTDALVREEHELKVIPEKMFRVKMNKKYDHFDLAQFYGHQPLDKVAKKLLGAGKESTESFDIANLSSYRYDHDPKYKAEIDTYLAQDVIITYKLAKRLQETLKPFLNPKYYYSQASPAQQYYLENAPRDLGLPPRAVMRAALLAYNGGRFEVFKRGTVRHAVTYDIKSAYPNHNSKIPALDKGTWTQNDKWDEDELVGLYEVIVTGNSHISPLRHEDKTGLYYPSGKKHAWVNHSEVETMRLYGYDVKILKAYHYHDPKPEYPFTFLKQFFYKKEEVGPESPEYPFYKIVINGFYGKTIQLNPSHYLSEDSEGAVDEVMKDGKMMFKKATYKAGLLFNPVVAQEITANTRSQLLKAVVDKQESIISFATDSITTTKRLNIPLSNKLGDWDVQGQGRFTSIGSGVYFYHHQHKMKFRGFGRGFDPHQTFVRGCDRIVLPVKRNHKLKKTWRSRKDGYDDMNVLFDDEKELILNFDVKRNWKDRFRKVDDIYDKLIESDPRKISIGT